MRDPVCDQAAREEVEHPSWSAAAYLCGACGEVSYADDWRAFKRDEEGELVPNEGESDPIIRCPICGTDHEDQDDDSGVWGGTRKEMYAERETQLNDAVMADVWIDFWKGRAEAAGVSGDERQPDALVAEKISRARGLAEAIAKATPYPPNQDGVRSVAGEIVSLLEAVPSVARATSEIADRPRGDEAYENGRGARAAGRALEANPETSEARHRPSFAPDDPILRVAAARPVEDAREAVADAHDYHLHDRPPAVIEAVAEALYRADEPSSANARAWACAAPKSRLYYRQRARESIEAMARPVTGTKEGETQ